jgi:hypothetical protein
MRRGDLALADSLLGKSVEIRRRANGPTHPLVGIGLLEQGDVSLRRHRFRQAAERLRVALTILEGADAVEPADIARARRLLGQARAESD